MSAHADERPRSGAAAAAGMRPGVVALATGASAAGPSPRLHAPSAAGARPTVAARERAIGSKPADRGCFFPASAGVAALPASATGAPPSRDASQYWKAPSLPLFAPNPVHFMPAGHDPSAAQSV